MKNNLIGAIAGWKSAALLALVAMVAAVAFSGVLTNTQPTSASAGDPKVDQEGSADITLTLDLSGNADRATALDVAKASTVNGYTVTDVSSAVDTVTVDDGDELTPAEDDDDAVISEGNWQVHDSAGGTAVKVTLTITPDDDKIAGSEFVVSAVGTTTDAAANTAVQVEVVGVAHPGGTVRVTLPVGTNNTYRISADSTASAGFTANPGRSFLICADDVSGDTEPTTCDLNTTSSEVDLEVTIDEDSAAGVVYIVADGQLAEEVTIKVSPAPISADLAITPLTPVSISSAADGDTEDIIATVTTSAGAGIEDVTVVFVTSLGRFTGACNSLPVCSLKTDDSGVATVSLQGDNRAGAATVKVTAGELSGSKDVTFYGKVAALSAANAGGITAINQDGAAFVIFTVTDKDGNPVPNVTTIKTKVTSEIEDATGVTDTTKLYEGAPGPADDVRSCADGTNGAGQCAVEVAASATATRGTHTVTASLDIAGPPPATLTDSVDVTVAGASDSISHDAPGRIDTLEEIKVTLTVTDDEGDLVGSQSINVTKVEGGGAILDEPAKNTANGSASFTFLASSIPGDVVFIVRSGDARAVINVAVGPEPEPVVEEEPEPEAPPATWNNELVSGQNVVVWNGADGAAPSEGAADGVSAIWSYDTGSGSWDGYFPDAADVPGGNTLGSLSSNQAYVVIVN